MHCSHCPLSMKQVTPEIKPVHDDPLILSLCSKERLRPHYRGLGLEVLVGRAVLLMEMVTNLCGEGMLLRESMEIPRTPIVGWHR